MVAAIRGDFCALFGLEMTGFAHSPGNAENADIAAIAENGKRRAPNAKRGAVSCPHQPARYLMYFSCFGSETILKLNEYFTRAETYYLYAASLSIERHLSSRSLGGSRRPFGGDRFEPYSFGRD
jgi:hypothetical protein